MYPDLEFLPRAPDPEEIIIEGDSAAPEVEVSVVWPTIFCELWLLFQKSN